MRPTFAQLTKNGGQATIEYILLLVIVLALILGPMKQFSRFFNAYIDALFGKDQYFACLLETGELSGQSTDPNSSCGAAFNARIQTAITQSGIGNPPANAAGSGSSSSSNSSNNPAEQSSSSQDAKKKAAQPQVVNASTSSSDSGGNAGADGGGSGTAGGGGVNGGRPHGGQVVKNVTPGRGKDPSEESFTKMEVSQFDYKNLKPTKGFEIPLNKLDRRYSLESEEAKRDERLTGKPVASTQTRNLREKELSLEPPRAPAAKDADVSGDGFGFSMLFKWFLIACILIALVIFVGGQALQISKGGDN